MFEDLRNIGDDHWSASSGLAPIPVDDEGEVEHDDYSDPEEVTTTSCKVQSEVEELVTRRGRKRRLVLVIGFKTKWAKLWR
jgi:hypothetical protein